MATPDYVPGKNECIHLIYRSDAGKIKANADPRIAGADGGVFDIACKPGSALPKNASSEVVAVNCPLCKASPVFKRIANEQDPMWANEADRAVIEHVRAAIEAEIADTEAAGQGDSDSATSDADE